MPLDLPRKSPHRTSLILGRAGETQIQPIKGPFVNNREGGQHVIEAEHHYWLRRPIPAGWLVVHTISDPEPISDRAPTGYGPIDIEMLTGRYLPRAWGAGKDPQAKTPPWVWWVLGGVALLFTIGAVVGVVLWKRSQLHAVEAAALLQLFPF